jgi:hypothetical protein
MQEPVDRPAEVLSTQLDPPPAVEAAALDEQAQVRARRAAIEASLAIEDRMRRGARWFYWIGGLSIANSILITTKASMVFVVGLGITEIIAFIGTALAEQVTPAARYAVLPLEIVLAGLFLAFGFLACKGHRWALITGIVLYALDTLIVVAFADWLQIGFHLLALYFLFGSLKAMKELRKAAAIAQPPLAENDLAQ